jgi:uncharacterized protein (TIGR02147 family)
VGLSTSQLKQIAKSVLATDHSDPRSFLQAVYQALKGHDPQYSYQIFSQDLGLGSANAHGMISGKRPLTEKSAQRISAQLGLTGVQKKYFLAMVHEHRAKSRSARESAFTSRLELKSRVLPSELDRAQLAFFEHWYHAAILEMLRLPECEGRVDWIYEHLSPSIPKQKIEESLDLLKSLSYVAVQEETGKLVPTDATITSGNEVLGLALQSYHRQMLGLSVDALDQLPREKRDISATTFTVSKRLAEQFKDEVIALRKRFLRLSAEETNHEEVYQLNIQLFSLIHKKER